ncbi:hypothetical protein Acr_26g0000150 [Actinidia rufa]|uniref:Uncharacterized protein n=1 Tax=Actinidia rufa TaxID=165716 RepID=A0A7J0H147_9ERIC|nr:hypothetical protein Acr_26g0000150 [Actinidia rufa]
MAVRETEPMDEVDLVEGATNLGNEVAGGDGEDVGAGKDVGGTVLKGDEVEAVTGEGVVEGGGADNCLSTMTCSLLLGRLGF